MILILAPLAISIICLFFFFKCKRNDDLAECFGCVFALSTVALMILLVALFLIRVCDSDRYQVEMDRANIVRYIETHSDEAETNDDIYNTMYKKVYSFNHTLYKRQRTRSSLLTNWFRAGWWLEIEPINWTP